MLQQSDILHARMKFRDEMFIGLVESLFGEEGAEKIRQSIEDGDAEIEAAAADIASGKNPEN